MQDFVNEFSVTVPVLIDGPCNEWWINYGQNPNGAVLLRPNGLVYGTNGWFMGYPQNNSGAIPNIDVYIQDLLGELSDIEEGSYTSGSVSIYPNPFKEQALIQISKEMLPYTLTILDHLGRIVKTVREINEESFVFEGTELESGIYHYLALSAKGESHSGKLMIIN